MKIYAFEVREDEEEYFRMMEEKTGTEIVLNEDRLTEENIPFLEPGSGVTILGMSEMHEKELTMLEKLGIRYLTTRTIGYNHIDLDAARKHHVHVCNSAYAPNGVADYTVMMILLCLRNYKQALWRMQVNDFSLGGLRGRELKDLTVGIMGTGRIGSTVAKELRGFGCRIIAYSERRDPAIEDFVEYMDLDLFYRTADIITLHVPLTKETFHIINDDSLAKMKDGVVLINCARGALTDIRTLTNGIETEKIGALGIDCIEEEEGIVHKDLKTDIFPDRDLAYLRQFKNVVYTQHMAFYTDAAVRSMVAYGVQCLIDMQAGKDVELQLC